MLSLYELLSDLSEWELVPSDEKAKDICSSPIEENKPLNNLLGQFIPSVSGAVKIKVELEGNIGDNSTEYFPAISIQNDGVEIGKVITTTVEKKEYVIIINVVEGFKYEIKFGTNSLDSGVYKVYCHSCGVYAALAKRKLNIEPEKALY